MQTPGRACTCPICGASANSFGVAQSGMCDACREKRDRERASTTFQSAVEAIMGRYNCSRDAAVIILRRGN